jgi:D-3-phosphoglycerate dehydrogenase
MAADTIREYIEQGTIRNSVNFPTTELSQREQNTIRISVVNQNIPGMLSKITEIFAKAKLNINQQINQSRGDIAYNVLDVDPTTAGSAGAHINLKEIQKEVTMLDGVLSSRILFGTPGAGYARKIDGQYFV